MSINAQTPETAAPATVDSAAVNSATVTFKDLCIDTTNPKTAAEFWSQALGLTATPRGDLYVLTDEVEEHTLWVNPVPEQKSVKNRVHLDVHVASLEEIEDLGAELVADDEPWTVMADPEGAEFCAFVRPPEKLPDYRLYELVVDCQDPEKLATWWATQFGIEAQPDPESFSWFLEGAPGMPWEMVFNAVPEPKTAKNRVHWDVLGDSAALVAAGATLVRARDEEIGWNVLADPEGNEFCVFAPEA
ncbi:MAG: VOC family protein [Propionibacteriaceae bacterium]